MYRNVTSSQMVIDILDNVSYMGRHSTEYKKNKAVTFGGCLNGVSPKFSFSSAF